MRREPPTPALASSPTATPTLVFLCTGNATRSVLAGAALRARRPDLHVATAGTLVVEGQPLSVRTRAAFEAVGLAVPTHRSRQADARLLDGAHLVVGLAPEHVAWVRRTHPAAAPRAATLHRLCRTLPPGADGLGEIAEVLAELALHEVELEPWEEIDDPGGREEDAYVACAREVVALVDRLAAAIPLTPMPARRTGASASPCATPAPRPHRPR